MKLLSSKKVSITDSPMVSLDIILVINRMEGQAITLVINRMEDLAIMLVINRMESLATMLEISRMEGLATMLEIKKKIISIPTYQISSLTSPSLVVGTQGSTQDEITV